MRTAIYKKHIGIFLLMAAIACETEEPETYTGKEFINFERQTATVEENTANPLTIKINLGGALPTSDVVVNYSVTPNDNAVALYEIENEGSVTIPAGEASAFVVFRPINNAVLDGEKTITLAITSVSGDYNIGFPGPDALNSQLTISIADDDCAFPSLVGTYKVVNRNASPAACGNPANDGDLTYTATITLVSDDGDGKFTYNVSDITGGLYALCYEDGENPGDITTDGFTISLIDQPDVVYGGDIFNGTGLISCNGNFTLTWSNGFGDKATSHYTKQ